VCELPAGATDGTLLFAKTNELAAINAIANV
jgi:hypothetical protein